jgi:hypothetical protein
MNYEIREQTFQRKEAMCLQTIFKTRWALVLTEQ